MQGCNVRLQAYTVSFVHIDLHMKRNSLTFHLLKARLVDYLFKRLTPPAISDIMWEISEKELKSKFTPQTYFA